MVAVGGFAGGIPLRRVLRVAIGLAVIGVEAALIAPHVSRGGDALADLRWGWVLAAIACEIASVATYGRLRRRLLSAGGVQLPLGRMGALAAASNAMAATIPAGAAVAAGYLYRQFRRVGASAPLAVWTVSAAAVVSGLAFSVLTMAGTILDGDDSLAGVIGAGGLSLVLVVGLIGALMLVTRHPRPIVTRLRALCAHLPGRRSRDCDSAADVDTVVAQLTAIHPRARDWGAAFWFASVSWAGDLACFVLCCYAVGVSSLGVGVAVIAYVAGLATSSLSLLPGGIGTVEAGFMVGLAHAGVTAPLAVAGILTYRVVAYGLVALVGWTAWALLRRRRETAGPDPDPVLEPALEPIAEPAAA
jgi:uncharacterized protein (TIRG00374 family)